MDTADKLAALAKAYAALCSEFQKDPMKCMAYREALNDIKS